MINSKKVKKYCREDIFLINNYEQAINDKEQMWDCHHINELTFTRQELIKQNMYYNRPSSELVFLTKSDHNKLHETVCAGANERNNKISNSLKGKKHSDERRRNISKGLEGRPKSEFGRKFIEHYGITKFQDNKLYNKEFGWYRRHNKCRWE